MVPNRLDHRLVEQAIHTVQSEFRKGMRMSKPIFRWNGEYFGFISNGRLFDKYSHYLGWVDGNEVWRKDGTYLGEIVEGAYILRRTLMATRTRRAVRATPATPAIRADRASRAPRAKRAGYVDALDEFK